MQLGRESRLVIILEMVNGEEREVSAYLAIVPPRPTHRKTTLAIARALSRYRRGGLSVSRAMAAASSLSAEIQALPVATMTVKPMASAKVMSVTTSADILQAHRIFLGSNLSGKKRSKKNAAPKMVATATPTKML